MNNSESIPPHKDVEVGLPSNVNLIVAPKMSRFYKASQIYQNMN